MPCSYYSPGEEASIRAQKASERANKYKKDLDRLGLEADKLREIVIEYLDGKTPEIPKELQASIRRAQTKHRKVDLARLEIVFTEKKDADKLEAVWEADPKKPLEPQLGFDPDEF